MIENTKVMLCIRFILLISLIYINIITPLYAERIYKWVDKNGVRNYSNLPNSVPEDLLYIKSGYSNQNKLNTSDLVRYNISESDLDQARKDYFYRMGKLQVQRKLIQEIRDLAKREEYLSKEYKDKQNLAVETKREFDLRIIQGYFADKSIIELKKFEVDMENINEELRLLIPKKKKLVSIARKQGIKDNLF